MIAETININFSKNKWQSAEWQEVRNPRFNYPGVMIQKDDHIVNKTPDVSAEEVFKKHCVDVFASMVMKRKEMERYAFLNFVMMVMGAYVSMRCV